MVREHRHKILLTALFLFVFLTRLYFSFTNPNFTHDSYYHLRHIESIQENYIPLYEDSLSYQGRSHYFPPLFHYFFAIMGTLINLEIIAKILPSLLFSTLIILVYELAKTITKNKNYALMSSLFFAFTPISYVWPINKVSPYSLAMPLFFSVVYYLIKIKEKNLKWMFILIILLVFTHPSAFLLVAGLLFYLALMKLEGLKIDKKGLEIIFFTIFLVFWALMLLYKNLFLTEGLGAIWQNIPEALLAKEFPELNIFEMVYFLGLVPLLLGVVASYQIVFAKHERKLLLIVGFTLAVFALLWLNYLRQEPGLLFLSVLLSVLSAYSLQARADFIDSTRLSKFRSLSMGIIILFFLLSSVFPLYVSATHAAGNTPSQETIEAYKWLENQTGGTMLSPLREGHLVTYFAKKKNVLDSNFLSIHDADERLMDARKAYTSRLKSEGLRILTAYDIDYIVLSKEAKQIYSAEKIYYLDKKCHKKIYADNATIYKIFCRLGEE